MNVVATIYGVADGVLGKGHKTIRGRHARDAHNSRRTGGEPACTGPQKHPKL